MANGKKAKMERFSGASLAEVSQKAGLVQKAEEPKVDKSAEVDQSVESRAVRRTKRDEAQLKAAEKYEDLKQKVLDRERENFSEIILIRDKEVVGSTKKRWWKALGHSVYILKYEIGKLHHLSFRIRKDDDFGPRSEEGTISIPDLDSFLERMSRLGYTEVKKAKEVVIIKLGWALTKEDYIALTTFEQEMVEKTGRLIRPEEVLQGLNAAVKELDKKTHEMVRKMDRQSQDAYANNMERLTVDMKIKVIRTARGIYVLPRLLDEVTEGLETLWGYLAVIMDRRAYTIEKVSEVGVAMRAVELQIDKERKKLRKRQKDEGSEKVK